MQMACYKIARLTFSQTQTRCQITSLVEFVIAKRSKVKTQRALPSNHKQTPSLRVTVSQSCFIVISDNNHSVQLYSSIVLIASEIDYFYAHTTKRRKQLKSNNTKLNI